MKPADQQAIGGSAPKLAITLWAFIVLYTVASIAQPDSLDDVYTTRAVVTGKDERNRPLGFKLCFEDVLVKASGDASIVNDSRFEALAAGAEQYVSSFSYRDRLEGKPVHDEQGTYDRPHFLTCRFDPQKIDSVLKTFGRKPWLAHRPRLVTLVAVHGRKHSGILSSDGAFDTAVLTRSDQWPNLAEMSGGELLLVGNLQWNDGALGWVATWSFKASGNRHRWSVRGVNYDEAFRNAVRGAARVLSGNGEPL